MASKSSLADLLKVGRDNWLNFLFAWLFPIFLYLALITESLFGAIRVSTAVLIELGLVGVLVLAVVVGVAPYRRRKVTVGQTLFWILLVPMVIFALLLLLPIRFPVITDIPTGPNGGG